MSPDDGVKWMGRVVITAEVLIALIALFALGAIVRGGPPANTDPRKGFVHVGNDETLDYYAVVCRGTTLV